MWRPTGALVLLSWVGEISGSGSAERRKKGESDAHSYRGVQRGDLNSIWLRVASKTMHKRQDELSLPNRAIGERYCGLFG